jgi:hypothetical protein
MSADHNRWFWPAPPIIALAKMTARDLTDEELVDDIAFAYAVLDTDPVIDDVYVEHEDGKPITLKELLAEAARRGQIFLP